MSDENGRKRPPPDVGAQRAGPAKAGKSVAEDTGDERLGYKRPPKHSQFQPGRSGNPRGRPPGVKSLSDIVRKIVGQMVTVTENGRVRRVPRLEAILLRAAGEASRGDARALKLLLQLTERYGESTQAEVACHTMTAEDLAILRRYLPDWDEGPGDEPKSTAETGGNP